MSLLSLLGISTAHASTAAAAHSAGAEGIMSMLPMLLIFVAAFYFLLIRPQQKRSKEHKSLVSNICVGDEIVTAGGIVGRLTKLRDGFIVIAIANGVEITMQKSSIASVLPKGTMQGAD